MDKVTRSHSEHPVSDGPFGNKMTEILKELWKLPVGGSGDYVPLPMDSNYIRFLLAFILTHRKLLPRARSDEIVLETHKQIFNFIREGSISVDVNHVCEKKAVRFCDPTRVRLIPLVGQPRPIPDSWKTYSDELIDNFKDWIYSKVVITPGEGESYYYDYPYMKLIWTSNHALPWINNELELLLPNVGPGVKEAVNDCTPDDVDATVAELKLRVSAIRKRDFLV